MSIPAFLYARYSAAEQGRGTSLVRQFENARRYATAKGWLLDPDREISDKGRSAFHGANRNEGGALHAFERKVRQGIYRNGAVFVVEHFDRISRQGWEEVHAFLKLCVENGVSVATIDGDRFYPAGQRIDGGTIMELVFKSEGAREESAKKSNRGLYNWSRKIEAIKAGDRRIAMGLPPGWMDRDKATQEVTLNKHRAKVLREIYDLYVEGHGLPAIVRRLNDRKEPSWAVGDKDKGQGWNTAYLHKLLTNRAVLGEYEPMSRTHGGINETSKGFRQADFYPQAIPTELFNRVQEVRTTRRKFGGPGEAQVRNLFAGSVFCAQCGSSMYFSARQKAGRETGHKSKKDGRKLSYVAKTDISYLICNSNRRGHGCESKARLRYEYLEPAILDAVLDVAIDDRRFTIDDRADAIRANIAELERQVEGKQHNLTAMREGLRTRFTLTLNDLIGETEAELESNAASLKAMRDDLARETGSATPSEHIERVREVRAALTSDDPEARYSARSRVKLALSFILRIGCHADNTASVSMLKQAMRWRFDGKGELLQRIDHLNEQPVTIDYERDYQAEESRRAAGQQEFDRRGKFISIYKESGLTVEASMAFVKGLKHDHPDEAQRIDQVMRRKVKG